MEGKTSYVKYGEGSYTVLATASVDITAPYIASPDGPKIDTTAFQHLLYGSSGGIFAAPEGTPHRSSTNMLIAFDDIITIQDTSKISIQKSARAGDFQPITITPHTRTKK